MLCLSTLVSILLLLVSRNAAAEHSTNGHGNGTNTVCTIPFYLVGDQCLFIGHELRGTWSQMRDVCLAIDGDLVSLSDANLLYDINNYIIYNGIADVSYWVGATDSDTEGIWLWTKDNTPVRMTSSVWGQLYGTQPNGGIDQNCGILSSLEFNYLHDEQCNTPMHGFICQAKQNEALTSRYTMPNIECPSDYELIGNECYQIHLETNYTWEEAKDLCSGNHRHLATLKDANQITEIRKYLIQADINLWIDGTDAETEGVWLHSDSSQVKRGTPFWRVFNDGQRQAPDLDTNYNCMATYFGYLYRFYDMYCPYKRGALCQYEV